MKHMMNGEIAMQSVFEAINGVFSFAVWHNRAKRLFIARDRMGIKPLFYSLNDNFLIFASEIKTLLAHEKIEPALDADGIAQIILLGPGIRKNSI